MKKGVWWRKKHRLAFSKRRIDGKVSSGVNVILHSLHMARRKAGLFTRIPLSLFISKYIRNSKSPLCGSIHIILNIGNVALLEVHVSVQLQAFKAKT